MLLTGMSGTGKSSVVRELMLRGYEDAGILFVAGCEDNQARFHARLDCEVQTTMPLNNVVTTILRLVGA